MATIIAHADDATNGPGVFDFSSTLVRTATTFSYQNLFSSVITFTATGSDPFSTYSGPGLGNIFPLTGTVASAEIASLSNTTKVTITGLNLPVAGNIDSSFSGADIFNAMFAGNDLFDGDSGGVGYRVYFYGDFFNLFTAATRYGGDDILKDGTNASLSYLHGDASQLGALGASGGNLIGGDDTFLLRSSNAFAFGEVDQVNWGRLIGGDDTFTVASNVNSVKVYGDAATIKEKGIVFGGDDSITDNSTAPSLSRLVGDAEYNFGGQLRGGDDTINVTKTTGGQLLIFGDATSSSGASALLVGGDDTITSNRSATIFGDADAVEGSAFFGNDKITGSVGIDTIFGDARTNMTLGSSDGGDDTINAGDGDDIIYGDVKDNQGLISTAGNDIIHGGEGNDQIWGDVENNTGTILVGGNDKIYGEQGDDTIYDGTGDSLVKGGAGDDTIYASTGNDNYDGGLDNDTILYFFSPDGVHIDLESGVASHGWAEGDTVTRFENIAASNIGDDLIKGTSGDNAIITFGGNDIVYDRGGNDTVSLGDNNDLLVAGGGTNSYDGGTGIDELSYRFSPTGVTVDLLNNSASGGFADNDTITGFENLTGSKQGNDVIRGTNGDNVINTLKGDDIVYTRAGTDTVNLGKGNDTVKLDAGDKTLSGGDGSDTISVFNAPAGIWINLADTAKLVSGTTATLAFTANAFIFGWSGYAVTQTGFENFKGSSNFQDIALDTAGDNRIETYGGDDIVETSTGNDTVLLGDGNDMVIITGAGTKQLDGGTGNDDVLDYKLATSGVSIDLLNNTASGSFATNNTISGFESVYGSNFGHDTLKGTSGANNIQGNYGRDRLFGRNGDDILDGGSGKDYLDGGHGNDSLTGGIGLDTFHFDKTDGTDTVTDFQDDVDTIEFFGYGFADAAAALALATEIGPNVVFDFGAGDIVTIQGTTKAALADDIDVV
jgi:Ca2+-binding RTX toxin-like protein